MGSINIDTSKKEKVRRDARMNNVYGEVDTAFTGKGDSRRGIFKRGEKRGKSQK